MNLIHMIKRQRCIDSAIWDTNTLRCSQCNEIIAIRYKFEEEVRIVAFGKFKRYKRQIESRKDCNEAAGQRDFVGTIHFAEFDDLLHDIRSRKAELFPIPENGEGICEAWEGEEPSGTEEADYIESTEIET